MKTPKKMKARARVELAKRELARRSATVFFDYVFEAKTQGFQKLWHANADKYKRAGFVAPRDHGKTTQMAIARTLFELGRNPDIRIKIVTAADDRAADILSEISRHVEQNNRLHNVFPNLKPADKGSWSKHKIMVQRKKISKDVSVEARGVMSTATGGRADLLIVDDPIDFNNAIKNPSQRETVKECFRSVWTNLLEPWGRAIYIGTAWHESDLMHDLLENFEWAFVIQRIRKQPGDRMKPLWPDKWGIRELKARRAEIGEREFSRQFDNRALSQDEALFSWDAVEACIDRTLSPADVDPKWPRFTGVDLAIGKGQESCFTVLFTLAQEPKTKIKYPVEIRRFKKRFPEQVKEIIRVWEEHDPKLIYVENNAYQQAMIDELKAKDRSIPVKPFMTGRQKADPHVGLPSLAIQFENQGWVIPLKGTHKEGCSCPMCTWVAEMRHYPIAKFDDTVMAAWFAAEAARKGGRPIQLF
jgi:hypothetical protein